ncbi:hypothetical protein GCM10010300_71510 [Streptomyces olivaceoviridis]|uniref:hypothetical protein n=1 Tax=Streptomyces olivaceoviridis TaxID=1921 RepID=UPI0016747A38|nr:hypothetical protein [Streptomyces olivaceoviridis]GGZ17396.1 hypothetical protein GCM10010300_71510 [Streptomyces olivaceoviridis]
MDYRAGAAENDARVGPEFVGAPCLPAGRRLQDWLRAFPDDTRPLSLEFGVGLTPVSSAGPANTSSATSPGARVVRASPAHPDLSDRAPPAPQTPTTRSAYSPPTWDADARHRSRRRAAAGHRGDR